MAGAPKDRPIIAIIRVPVRWYTYSPKSQEVRRGKMGRWQSMNEWGGWDNLHPDKPPEDWEEWPVEAPQTGSNLKP